MTILWCSLRLLQQHPIPVRQRRLNRCRIVLQCRQKRPAAVLHLVANIVLAITYVNCLRVILVARLQTSPVW